MADVDVSESAARIATLGAAARLLVSDAAAELDGDQVAPATAAIAFEDLPAASADAAGLLSTDLWQRGGLSLIRAPEEDGAVGDGATDDRTAFVDAIAALAALGGGRLRCTPGRRYAIDAGSIALADRVELDLNGATLVCSIGDADLFTRHATRASRGERIALFDGTIEFDDARSCALSVKAVSGVLVQNVEVGGGRLFRAWLPSDAPGLTGAGWDPASPSVEPDLSQVTDADLCDDVRLIDNLVAGGGVSASTARPEAEAASVHMAFTRRWSVSGLTARGDARAVYWYGGDDAVDRDGAATATSPCRHGVVAGVVATDMALAPVSGSRGWDVVAVTGLPVVELTPEQFRALGDGTTDDGDALQRCADFCRANKIAMRLAGRVYHAGTATLYLGGVVIRGVGAPANLDWFGPASVIRADGNPGVSSATSANSNAPFASTDWASFGIRGAGRSYSGAAIDLWDEAAYPYQIGLWLGHSHRAVDADADTEGGSFGVIRDVTVQDCSGWGVYIYRGFGKSELKGLHVRACGGPAARARADDAAGGGVKVVGSVDLRFSDWHLFSNNHEGTSASDDDGWGTALQLGEVEPDVRAGFTWEPNANVWIRGFHSENFPRLGLIDGRDGAISEINFNGGVAVRGDGVTPKPRQVIIGWGANPANNARFQVGQFRVGNCDDILISERTELRGQLFTNGAPGVGTTRLNWWGEIAAAVDTSGLLLVPRLDRAAQPGGAPGSPDVLPWLRAAGVLEAEVDENLLPPPSLRTGGAAYSGTDDVEVAYAASSGAPSFRPDGVRLNDGSVTPQEFEIDVVHAARLDGFDQVLDNVGGATLPFDAGATEITVGQTVTGASSSASGEVTAVELLAGTWAGGDAEGVLTLTAIAGTPFTDGENLQVSAATVAVAQLRGTLSVHPDGGGTAFETWAEAEMNTSNGTSIASDAAGAFGEVYLPAGPCRIRVVSPAGTVLREVDGVTVGEPLTCAFWADGGAGADAGVTFGLRDAAGTLVRSFPLAGTFPVNGRAVFRAWQFLPPRVVSGGDARFTLFWRNEGTQATTIRPVLLRGLLTGRRHRGRPAVWPSARGGIDRAAPGVVLRATAVWDPGSIPDGDAASQTFTVTGAAVGDYALAAPGVDVADLTVSASVTAADTVTVVLANATGAAVDLASSTWAVEVRTR